jgi:hypothetical protein
MPVRRLDNRQQSVVGHFPSLKMQRMVPFKNTLQRDYLYLLDYDPHVLTFGENTPAIPYQHQGQKYQYTPSFLLRFACHLELVACEPTAHEEDDVTKRQIDAAQAWCKTAGYMFRILTEQEIRAGYRLNNVKLLTRYARHPISIDARARIYQALAVLPVRVTLGDLTRAVQPITSGLLVPDILHLVFHHQLAADLDAAPLTDLSLIHLPFQLVGGLHPQ